MPDTQTVMDLIEKTRELERAGQVTEAFQHAQQALNLAKGLGDANLIAAALVEFARVCFRMGLYDEARQKAEEGLALAGSDDLILANGWQVLANCAAEVDSLRKAETCYYRATTFARRSGNRRALMAALHGLATGVYIPNGLFELALAAELEVVHIARSESADLPYPMISLAMIYQTTGQAGKAHDTLAELSPHIDPGSLFDGYRLCLGGSLALDEGDLMAAEDSFSQARSVAEASGEPWLNITVRSGMSRLNRLRGETVTALRWSEEALAYALRVGYRHEAGKAMTEVGQVYWQCGREKEALEKLESAAELLSSLGANCDLAHCLLVQAGLLHQSGRPHTREVFARTLSAILSGGYAFLVEKERRLSIPLLAGMLNEPDQQMADQISRLLENLKRVPPPALKISLLGRFDVRQRGTLLDKRSLRQRNADRLLALLCLSREHKLPAEQVCESLWPEKSPSAALTALHHATSTLRRALESDLPEKFPSRYVEMNAGWLILHLPEGSSLDVETFEEHYLKKRWMEAVNTYGGDLLPEFQPDSWTAIPRQRLNLIYQQVLLEAAQVQFSQERYQEALETCQRLLEVEPWHEQAALLGMRSARAVHNITTARRIYLDLAKKLADELDAEPQAELRQFFQLL